MIAIIEYGAGNICSVSNALDRLGAEYVVTSEPDVIRSSDRVILPGVGNASKVVSCLMERGLRRVIRDLRQPVLGICVGMQVLCRDSEEDGAKGLDVFDSHVLRFPDNPAAKVPHMGWNKISNLGSKLFSGIDEGSFVYFVHSYHPCLCQDTIATCRHGDVVFSAALKYENFYGTQFHPEKSGDVGGRILQNFLSL